MNAKWLVGIVSAWAGAVAVYQACFANNVSEEIMVLRLALYVVKVVLLVAIGRPHPKITNHVGQSLFLFVPIEF
jgi:hypothetical protein